jgi:hypothetical protein
LIDYISFDETQVEGVKQAHILDILFPLSWDIYSEVKIGAGPIELFVREVE